MGGIYVSGDYPELNPDWHDEDGSWKAHQILRMLERHPGLPVSRVVDVGCGTGRVLATLAPHLPEGTRLEGYDIAGPAVAMAQRHARDGLSFTAADFLEATTGQADLILLMDVFEHVPDYLGFLRRLRERGRAFLFHIPLDMNALHVMADHQASRRATCTTSRRLRRC